MRECRGLVSSSGGAQLADGQSAFSQGILLGSEHRDAWWSRGRLAAVASRRVGLCAELRVSSDATSRPARRARAPLSGNWRGWLSASHVSQDAMRYLYLATSHQLDPARLIAKLASLILTTAPPQPRRHLRQAKEAEAEAEAAVAHLIDEFCKPVCSAYEDGLTPWRRSVGAPLLRRGSRA